MFGFLKIKYLLVIFSLCFLVTLLLVPLSKSISFSSAMQCNFNYSIENACLEDGKGLFVNVKNDNDFPIVLFYEKSNEAYQIDNFIENRVNIFGFSEDDKTIQIKKVFQNAFIGCFEEEIDTGFIEGTC